MKKGDLNFEGLATIGTIIAKPDYNENCNYETVVVNQPANLYVDKTPI